MNIDLTEFQKKTQNEVLKIVKDLFHNKVIISKYAVHCQDNHKPIDSINYNFIDYAKNSSFLIIGESCNSHYSDINPVNQNSQLNLEIELSLKPLNDDIKLYNINKDVVISELPFISTYIYFPLSPQELTREAMDAITLNFKISKPS